jgi:hypothetical protein
MEYIKIIRLSTQEYGLEFWEQPTVIKELENTIKFELQRNGEKLAETKPNITLLNGRPLSCRLPWYERSFIHGETLSPGYTGFELRYGPVQSMVPTTTFFRLNPMVIVLYAEIA